MSIPSVTDRNFEQGLRSQGVTLVDFGAPWCPPCRTLEPILESLAEEYAGKVGFVQVNCDESPESAGRFGIMSMPTVVVFKDGEPVAKLVGLQRKEAYREIIARYQ